MLCRQTLPRFGKAPASLLPGVRICFVISKAPVTDHYYYMYINLNNVSNYVFLTLKTLFRIVDIQKYTFFISSEKTRLDISYDEQTIQVMSGLIFLKKKQNKNNNNKKHTNKKTTNKQFCNIVFFVIGALRVNLKVELECNIILR